MDAAARRRPRRHSLREQVLGALRAALVSGELEAGEVYSAPALAGRFGVSATPVREAMQQLVREGAVEAVPNKGFRVARRSEREAAELAEVRALLEIPVILRMARVVPESRWRSLEPLVAEAMEAAERGDAVTYAEADRRFHRGLLGLSGNGQLVAVAGDLQRRVVVRGALTADAREHGLLLEAVVAGDLEMVEEVARRHLRR